MPHITSSANGSTSKINVAYDRQLSWRSNPEPSLKSAVSNPSVMLARIGAKVDLASGDAKTPADHQAIADIMRSNPPNRRHTVAAFIGGERGLF
jgi:hypothetical protein